MVAFKKHFTQFKLYGILAVSLLFSVAPVASVYAISDYDDVIPPLGGELKLHLPVNEWGMGRCSQPYANDPINDDLSTSLSTYLLDPDYYTNQTVGAEGAAFWNDLLHNSNYAWSIDQYTAPVYTGNLGYKTLTITASTTKGAEFTTIYDANGPHKVLRTTGTDTRTFSLDYYSYGYYNAETNPLGIRCGVHVNYVNNFGPGYIEVEGDSTVRKTVFNNFDISYPEDYAGVIPSDTSDDSDDDGLTLVQEAAIGTSDTQVDSDSDGLGDFIESVWNPDRDWQFCNTSTPKNCAYPSPIKKDIYVEVDWMKNGSELYKPSSDQLNLVVSMFANKNIAVHFDTGQYGGGNELPSYTQNLRTKPLAGYVAFRDYKDGGEGIPANFALIRDNIWHYMIYGNKYIANSESGHLYDTTPSGSSGVSEVGGDDIFIAGKVIEGTDGVESQDLAIASTIAHELGHNLCLTDVLETGDTLPSECAYAGVDNKNENDDYYNLVNYKSVMNYRYQLTEDYLGSVDYSDGTHGTLLDPKDHDDWGAVMLGMSSFSNSARTGLGSRSSEPAKRTMDSRLMVNH